MVAQLTGYAPLPDGAPPPPRPAILPPPPPPPPPLPVSDDKEEDEEEAQAPVPALEGQGPEPATLVEEGDGEEQRSYGAPRITAELQPMLRCWAVRAWAPPLPVPRPTIGDGASARVLFPDAAEAEAAEGEEQGRRVRVAELRVRFCVGESRGEGGCWFQAALPFITAAPSP